MMTSRFLRSAFTNESLLLHKKGTSFLPAAAAVMRMSSTSELTEISLKQGVKTITMCDMDTRNSLSWDMLNSLHTAVTDTNPDLRCIIIKAKGPVFSAGHNLKQIKADNKEGHIKLFERCSELMMAIKKVDVPVIAQVNGVAAAAGCQLVASCDIVVASDKSSFSVPGANVGIFCSTPGIPLVRAVPKKVSAYMLLSGRFIDAHEALQAGLVSKIVPPHLLDAETYSITQSIVAKSKSVLSLGKKFMYEQMEMTEEEAYRKGVCVIADNINMKDGQEGIASFVEKRKPDWTHKHE